VRRSLGARPTRAGAGPSLLLLAPAEHDRKRRQLHGRRDQRRRGGYLRKLLAIRAEADAVGAATAVLLGDGEPDQAPSRASASCTSDG
jgi:hypothetical protein